MELGVNHGVSSRLTAISAEISVGRGSGDSEEWARTLGNNSTSRLGQAGNAAQVRGFQKRRPSVSLSFTLPFHGTRSHGPSIRCSGEETAPNRTLQTAHASVGTRRPLREEKSWG